MNLGNIITQLVTFIDARGYYVLVADEVLSCDRTLVQGHKSKQCAKMAPLHILIPVVFLLLVFAAQHCPISHKQSTFK